MVPLHQSVIWLAPCHHISQSFDLPTPTTSVSHLTCPLPPYHQSELVLVLALEIELVLVLDIERYHITASIIWLAPCHHISLSFDLPTATTSVSHLTCSLPLHYHIGQSFDLPPPHQSIIWLAPTTTSVSHLTCPLPPHQSVIWLAHCHHIISQS